MMNGRRVATASGAILADAALIDPALTPAPEMLFEPRFWADHGRIRPVDGGRGTAWFVDHGAERWVLRHYRRGGFMSRVSEDRYLWMGEPSVRAFAEYRLLADLRERGLPVPVPLGARYQRYGLRYRCDLITRRICGAASVSGALADAPLSEDTWRQIGFTIARFHAAGVDHADLNAHNVLLDARGTVSIVDFDRGRLRTDGAWARRNLTRLHRSLVKIAASLPADRFPGEAWRHVLAGYRDQRSAADE
jgi:3-deoxy-D-manno-octulosonic acid kinase